MASKFSSRSTKVYNNFRTIFQYVACNWVILNILRTKYNLLKTEGLENIDRTKKGNNAGITVLIHSSMPDCAPSSASLLSKINTRRPHIAIILFRCFPFPSTISPQKNLCKIHSVHSYPFKKGGSSWKTDGTSSKT